MKNYILILLAILTFSCKAQNGAEYLTKSEIENDLAVLDKILQSKSSYQGLNGYNYKDDFNKFLEKTEGETITKSDFGLFLSKTIGKIRRIFQWYVIFANLVARTTPQPIVAGRCSALKTK